MWSVDKGLKIRNSCGISIFLIVTWGQITSPIELIFHLKLRKSLRVCGGASATVPGGRRVRKEDSHSLGLLITISSAKEALLGYDLNVEIKEGVIIFILKKEKNG